MKREHTQFILPGLLVAIVAFQMFWPKSSVILVSPDGKNRVSISATNEGARIELITREENAIAISSSPNGGPHISLESTSPSPFSSPVISLSETVDGGRRPKLIRLD